MIDHLNNVESEYRCIQRTLRATAMENHEILIHLRHFLPEESDNRPWPITPKILPFMLLSIALKIMLSKSRLCSRTDCFIRVYLPFLTTVLV